MKTWAFETMHFLSHVRTPPLRKPQVSWLWKRKIRISFWLSVSWYTYAHWSSFFFLSFFPLAKVRVCFGKQHSNNTSLAGPWSICQQNKMWNIHIYTKVVTFQRACLYHLCDITLNQDVIFCLIARNNDPFSQVSKMLKIHTFLLCCLIEKNNTPYQMPGGLDWTTWHISFQRCVSMADRKYNLPL